MRRTYPTSQGSSVSNFGFLLGGVPLGLSIRLALTSAWLTTPYFRSVSTPIHFSYSSIRLVGTFDECTQVTISSSPKVATYGEVHVSEHPLIFVSM